MTDFKQRTYNPINNGTASAQSLLMSQDSLSNPLEALTKGLDQNARINNRKKITDLVSAAGFDGQDLTQVQKLNALKARTTAEGRTSANDAISLSDKMRTNRMEEEAITRDQGNLDRTYDEDVRQADRTYDRGVTEFDIGQENTVFEQERQAGRDTVADEQFGVTSGQTQDQLDETARQNNKKNALEWQKLDDKNSEADAEWVPKKMADGSEGYAKEYRDRQGNIVDTSDTISANAYAQFMGNGTVPAAAKIERESFVDQNDPTKLIYTTPADAQSRGLVPSGETRDSDKFYTGEKTLSEIDQRTADFRKDPETETKRIVDQIDKTLDSENIVFDQEFNSSQQKQLAQTVGAIMRNPKLSREFSGLTDQGKIDMMMELEGSTLEDSGASYMFPSIFGGSVWADRRIKKKKTNALDENFKQKQNSLQSKTNKRRGRRPSGNPLATRANPGRNNRR